jgi:hypothetical protein
LLIVPLDLIFDPEAGEGVVFFVPPSCFGILILFFEEHESGLVSFD